MRVLVSLHPGTLVQPNVGDGSYENQWQLSESIVEETAAPLDIELTEVSDMNVQLVLNNRSLSEILQIKYMDYHDAYSTTEPYSTTILSGETLSLSHVLNDYNVCGGDYKSKVEVTDIYGNVTTSEVMTYWNCFVAGTQVLTEQGLKNIEDIQVGEKVYSYNRETKEYELNKVLDTIKNIADSFVELTIGDEKVKCTPKHRFYVAGKGWIEAGKLNIGDKVFSKDNSENYIVKNIEYTNEVLDIYNLSVEKNHNYFITKYNLLVHNAKSVS